ncbi:interferon regulatory factor 7 isoform X2 [Numida meleagris]|uniref:interferon regulatory factor 7 isoform X2 n=1 Tax=Numida meleagris TaxID=8996 RepID=UPI000B3DF975|nr:interferon regulatory factor 7 isoform X2 [Numida meleagris]XP_021259530.1 interferon regulatory factor 7 isoform X2 [Numida meleagris]XP_021259531.1 interferon regulatory factor 7 isoform X2 [Numida meleagris]
MAALHSEGDTQKLRFGPWLLDAVSSGLYQGLCWINPARRVFRIPWKHNARKDVTSSDVEIFKAWAKASGRYEESSEDPAKWKTNFRCALRSTHMFMLLEDRSKCNDDPHKVYAVDPAVPSDRGFGGPVMDTQLQQPQLLLNHHDVASETTPTDSADGAAAPALTQEDLDILQSVLQHCNISALAPQPAPWANGGDALPGDALLLPGPGSCHPVPPFQEWGHLEDQATCSLPEPLLLGDQPLPGGGCGQNGAGNFAAREECVIPAPSLSNELLFQPANPAPPPPAGDTGELPLILDITIYYRGKTVHQELVGDSPCVLAYQPLDPAVAEQRLVLFPSPADLADPRQRHYTEDLLGVVGLRLEQRAGQLLATRLKKCKVFWALSQQLEGGEPPTNLLQREKETTIFDFNVFCTELRDFRDRRRERSPDFTIFLCFGQSFSSRRPKESKLILVKLVPKFCEYWYEQVQREGASSLNSGNVSLQLSDSFNLFELIEQYHMQTD